MRASIALGPGWRAAPDATGWYLQQLQLGGWVDTAGPYAQRHTARERCMRTMARDLAEERKRWAWEEEPVRWYWSGAQWLSRELYASLHRASLVAQVARERLGGLTAVVATKEGWRISATQPPPQGELACLA